nr:hypothetical protein [Tanacetum cinerariifolium]
LSSRLASDQTSNPTSSMNTTRKGRNRRSSKQKVENSNLEEHLPPVVTMADNRTVAEMLRAPTEGQSANECCDYHHDGYAQTVAAVNYNQEREEVYYECKEPFKSLKCLWVMSKSIAVTWLEKVVTPLIESAIKGFAAASAVLKLERLKVDRHGMSEPMSYYLIN